jgi:hypothetical protein
MTAASGARRGPCRAHDAPEGHLCRSAPAGAPGGEGRTQHAAHLATFSLPRHYPDLHPRQDIAKPSTLPVVAGRALKPARWGEGSPPPPRAPLYSVGLRSARRTSGMILRAPPAGALWAPGSSASGRARRARPPGVPAAPGGRERVPWPGTAPAAAPCVVSAAGDPRARAQGRPKAAAGRVRASAGGGLADEQRPKARQQWPVPGPYQVRGARGRRRARARGRGALRCGTVLHGRSRVRMGPSNPSPPRSPPIPRAAAGVGGAAARARGAPAAHGARAAVGALPRPLAADALHRRLPGGGRGLCGAGRGGSGKRHAGRAAARCCGGPHASPRPRRCRRPPLNRPRPAQPPNPLDPLWLVVPVHRQGAHDVAGGRRVAGGGHAACGAAHRIQIRHPGGAGAGLRGGVGEEWAVWGLWEAGWRAHCGRPLPAAGAGRAWARRWGKRARRALSRASRPRSAPRSSVPPSPPPPRTGPSLRTRTPRAWWR